MFALDARGAGSREGAEGEHKKSPLSARIDRRFAANIIFSRPRSLNVEYSPGTRNEWRRIGERRRGGSADLEDIVRENLLANHPIVHPSKLLAGIQLRIVAAARNMLIDEIRAARQRAWKNLAANCRAGPQ